MGFLRALQLHPGLFVLSGHAVNSQHREARCPEPHFAPEAAWQRGDLIV